MPKFEKLEEAQAAHDKLEGDVTDLKKEVAKLNGENAGRRKREEELEKENKRLKDDAMTDAEKQLKAKITEEVKAELDKGSAKDKEDLDKAQAEIKRLTLEGAAAKAGFKEPADAVKLLGADVEPEKLEEAFKTLGEKYPGMLTDGGDGSDVGGGVPGKGGSDNSVDSKLKSGQPISVEELRGGGTSK